MEKVLCPTGLVVIRNDAEGLGHFGASRGGRTHLGVDFQVRPGHEIVSPITGTIKRIAWPYKVGGEYSGLLIENKIFECKMFYFLPFKSIVGNPVLRGETIGNAQAISLAYPGMFNHIHMQLMLKPFTVVEEYDNSWNQRGIYVDPLWFMDIQVPTE